MPDVQLYQHELLMRRIHPEGFRVVGTRQIHNTERNCINCSLHGDCWNPRRSDEHSKPEFFALRSNWNPDNFIPYMKSIFAGICGSFVNSDPVIRERQAAVAAQREAEKAAKQPKEWED